MTRIPSTFWTVFEWKELPRVAFAKYSVHCTLLQMQLIFPGEHHSQGSAPHKKML